MPIDNLSKITSRTGISTTILLEAGNVNATGIITAAGFNGPFTGGGAIAAGIITGTGLEISGISTLNGNLSVTGLSTFSDDIFIPDNKKIRFGDPSSPDLEIYHGGNASFISDIGGGVLKLTTDGLRVRNASDNQNMIKADQNLGVELFYNNTKRFTTSGIGVTIIGEADVNGNLSVSGVSTFTGIITASGNVSIGGTLDLSMSQVGFDNPSQIKLSDLVIGQHQNTGSYKIENGSTGSLLLRADMINFATSNGGTSLLRSSTSEVQIFSGNTNRFTVNGVGATVFGELDVTGDVGIGTTNPHKRLHVADYGTHGAIRVEGSGNGNRSGIEFYRETSAGVSKGGAAIWVESDTSSSAGKLRFGTASNAAIQSQTTDMILDNNGRLGIGTDNPLQKLHVADGTSANIYIETKKSDTGSTAGLYYKTSSSTASDFFKTGIVLEDDGTSHARGKLHILQNNTADGSNATLSDSVITFTQDGKVGIGSTNPAAQLDVFKVNGTIAVFGDGRTGTFERIAIKNNVSGYPAITNDSSPDTLDLRSFGSVQATIDSNNNSTGKYFRVMTNGNGGAGTELFRVGDDGKVGIGSTIPSTELDVEGDINFQDHMLIANMSSAGVGGSNIDHIWHSDAADPKAGGTWNFVSDGTAKQVGNSVIQAGYLKTSSGGSLFGSVGIGTTDPASNLNLFAAIPSNTSGILVQNVLYASKQDKPYLTVGTHGWTGADTNWNTYGFQHKIKSNNEGVPRVTIDSSGGTQREKFCVDNGGKVGIGTTDPDSRLHVYGANEEDCILILESDKDDSNDEHDNPYIVFRQDGGKELATVGMNPYGIDAENNALVLANSVVNNGGIIFKTGTTNGYTNAIEALRIHDDGTVGIGTNNPQEKLEIYEGDIVIGQDSGNNTDIRNYIKFGRVNAPKAAIGFINNAGNGRGDIIFMNSNASNASAFSDTDEVVRITSTGNVGIGTTNPDAPLHILSDANNMVQIESTDRHSTLYLIDSIGSSFIQNDSGELRFGVGGGASAAGGETEAVRIDSDGRVGIGTVNPAVRLDVRNDSGTSASTEPLVALHHSVNDVDGEVLRIGRTDIPTIRYHSLFSEHSGGASSNTLKFYMHDPARSVTSTRQVLTLQGNGRVGIGTTNGGLDAALEVCSDEGAFIKSFTNASPARVRFSDLATNGSYGQFMTIDYRHSNNAVLSGTEEGLHIYGSEDETAVVIDGLLRVTEQPCAVVYQAKGPAGGSINDAGSDNKEPIHFDHVHINQGGMAIANDNARITVPVAGNYLVSGMIAGGVSNIDTNDGIELLFLVDGSEHPASNSGIEPVFNFGHGHDPSENMAFVAHTEYFCSNTTILTLAENDYVELAVDNIGSTAAASVNRGHLSVALLN